MTVGTLPGMATDTRQTRDRTEFGQRLLTARKHAQLTQTELGERSGIGQSGIAYLESKGYASEQTWRLAQICGVRVAWLANGEGPMQGPETAVEAAREVLGQLPELVKPNSSKDYRTIVHTLAQSLEDSGVTLSIKQFLNLADEVFKNLGGK